MKGLLLGLLLLANIAQAEAPSLLGMCHPSFNCRNVKRLYSGHDVIIASWLENTFGTECKCVDELLNDRRPKIIRAHLINSPCMRNKRCGKYEVLHGYTAKSASREFIRGKGKAVTRFKRVVLRFKKRLAKAPDNVQCYVSPCLECDLNDDARRVLHSIVADALPNCISVDNPLRHRCLPGMICEKHGVDVKLKAPCIADLDGTDGATVDVASWFARVRQCELVYYWEPWMNCLKGSFTDPRKRDCAFPQQLFDFTRRIICQYFYLLSDICLR